METGERTGELAINAADFQKMIIGASYFFDREKEAINALNVFPVPDGDTGTNMSMTLAAAAEAALIYRGDAIGEIAVETASSALMGARGNSGVILSQLLRGIARGLQGKKVAYPDDLSKAFQYGVVYAYKAVSKPVEGTILTVARETARGARSAARSGADLCGIIETAIENGREALARTTEMLPVLKEAGVVDAGGMGLVVFLEGCLFAVPVSYTHLDRFNRLLPYRPGQPLPGDPAGLAASPARNRQGRGQKLASGKSGVAGPAPNKTRLLNIILIEEQYA